MDYLLVENMAQILYEKRGNPISKTDEFCRYAISSLDEYALRRHGPRIDSLSVHRLLFYY